MSVGSVVNAIKALLRTDAPSSDVLEMEPGSNYDYPPDVLRKKNTVSGSLLFDNQTKFASFRGEDGTAEYLVNLLASPSSKPTAATTIDVSTSRALQARCKLVEERTNTNIPEFNGPFPMQYGIYQIGRWEMDLAVLPNVFVKCVQGIIRVFGTTEKLAQLNQYAPRLVITPSYDRYMPQGGKLADTYLFKNNYSDLWENSGTTHIILVQPYQKDMYIAHFCPRGYLVATMPSNEEGVGSARFWCTMLCRATRFETFFMLDDSYAADNMIKVPNNGSNDGHPLRYGVEFIENVFAGLFVDEQSRIGAISLRRFSAFKGRNEPVAIRFCQGFVFVNIKSTFDSGVFYRRGLLHAEDMLFSANCLRNKLFPIEIQDVLFYDLNTKAKAVANKGAHSPNLSGSKSKPVTQMGSVTITDSFGAKRAATAVKEGDNVDELVTSMGRATLVEDDHEVDAMSRSLVEIWSKKSEHIAFLPVFSSDETARYVWMSRKQENLSSYSPLEKEFVEWIKFEETMRSLESIPVVDRLYRAMAMYLADKEKLTRIEGEGEKKEEETKKEG